MANEQKGMPLRRWRNFYGAFSTIDDAIEEAAVHPRAAFQDVRVGIVKLLRAATDDGVAEELCAALDDAMVEALVTLRVVAVPHCSLASSDLARAVGALRKHGSPRIRRLADDVVRGWTAGNIVTTTAVKVEEELGKLPADDRIPRQGISAVIADGNARGHKEKSAKMLPATAEVHKEKLHVPPAKKMLPTVPVDEARKKRVYVPPAKVLPTASATVSMPNTKPPVDESKKMEATKRKLQEGYQEDKRIKLQHLIKKMDDKDASKLFEQKVERKMVRGRGLPAACRSRTSSGVRRSLLPTLQMI